jgi:site-specific recombinase XerD
MKKQQTWEPPSGMWYEHRPKCRKRPYYLFWRDSKGTKTWERYEDEKGRELAAKRMAEALASHGASTILTFDPEKWRTWLQFEAMVGPGVDPLIVAAEWKASRQGKAGSSVGMQLETAITKYFAIRKAEKSWGRDAERHAELHLKERFHDAYFTKRINDITTEDIRTWLGSLKGKDGDPMHDLTVKDHRKNLATFFDYAVREGWVSVNPVAAIKPPKVEQADVHVISVREAFAFFKANRDSRCIGRVALEAFGGVRYSTAGKIDKEGINFEQKGIRMLGKTHKSGKTKYRQGQPDNLWDWLKHAPETCWTMTALQYREEKRAAAIKSGLRPASIATNEDQVKMDAIANIWRHSFASYHLARYKKVPLTQYLMQHSNPKTTEIYEGVADETDAARYLMITPQTVLLEWEQFLALEILPYT